ncbi:MAG: sulfurtransferase TusA family protein [Candidatus Korarchaeum sp.]|nr:sulfurtransferase TusA family protein [Candidatus Korarchaeum sp.]MDW8036033.1 sulfurtransferase TusA family protein [Candidatus Korarchaeum sp.]
MTKPVDLRSMRSPRSIVQIAKIVSKSSPGETISFLIGDKESIDDLYEWIRRTGHVLRSVSEKGGYWIVQITKKEG